MFDLDEYEIEAIVEALTTEIEAHESGFKDGLYEDLNYADSLRAIVQKLKG